jgi:two-component sensor histidine kinase
MATRAREFLDRSRSLLDRSRAVAAQFLATPPRVEPAPTLPASQRIPDRGPEHEEALVGICSSVALRDLNLVDSLLAQLEEMEAKEENADRLGELYRLDHLATRLRRNAENLRVLAGRDADDNSSETASLVDVIRAAMSSIDHYSRVTIGRVVGLGVVGFAAEDMSRLLAELLDNATNQSPPESPVRVSAHLTEQGSVLLRIEDEGIGLPGERLCELNDRLVAKPVLDNESVRHMGLAVVRRLAARHGMRAHLERRAPHGTTATVLLPAELVCELAEARWSGAQTVVFPQSSGTPGGNTHGPAAGQGGVSTLSRPDTAKPADNDSSSPSALPRRRPSADPESSGTTSGGLPRRVSRSIKDTGEEQADTPAVPEQDEQAGYDQFLADLGAFTDGERAAREKLGQQNHKPDNADSAEGPQA